MASTGPPGPEGFLTTSWRLGLGPGSLLGMRLGHWPRSHGLAVAEYSHGEVLDVSGPLGCKLEELDIIPLHPVDGHCGPEEQEVNCWTSLPAELQMTTRWCWYTTPGCSYLVWNTELCLLC